MRLDGQKKDAIAPEMFGLFFEDINFAADGGLYAELLENRSFEAREAFGIPGCFYTVEKPGYAWSAVAAEDGTEPVMKYVGGIPLSEENPHYLRLITSASGQGFANKAYDGIALKKGEKYKVSFYARCIRYRGSVTASVEKDGKTYADGSVQLKIAVPYAPFVDSVPDFHVGWDDVEKAKAIRSELDLNECAKESDWVKYEIELTAAESVKGARFVIRLQDAGIVEFDLISMIPSSAVAGIFRKDLFDALDAMHPGFIRFPGGCIVEGVSLDNRYRWKRTVGPLKDRKVIPNLWAFADNRALDDPDAQRPDPFYSQSYGIGFYEYFLLCELLGAKPLPVVGIGAACQFRSDQMVDGADPEFAEFVQDAIDLIEFANGDVTTKWGALRASMGHPESFGLELLSAGNEQWDTKDIRLFERVDAFEKAIHAMYPDIKLIGSAGPIYDFPLTQNAWDIYRSKCNEIPNYCYAIDEHYYSSPEWMYSHLDMYDDYSRSLAVFAGEYAAHNETRANSMETALAEAAFMTGLEKNAGVVKLASYAPLFNRIGHSQWKPDMIWFDEENVILTPNYYVQKMYATATGDFTIDMAGEEKALREARVYVSLSGMNDGTVIVKAANCSDADYELPLVKADGSAVTAKAVSQVLTAAGEEPEDLPQPSCVTESEVAINGAVTLPASSFTVLKIAGLLA